MKKLFFAALAGVALVGCTNDESLETTLKSQKIMFDNPVLSLATKAPGYAGEISGSAYPDAESFAVYAKVYKGSFNGWSTSTEIKDFWTGSEVASKDLSGSSYWTTTGAHYWPNEPYKLAFAAYSPSCIVEDNDVASVTYDEDGFKFTAFKVKAKLDEQYDLMYSSRNLDCDKINCVTGVPVKFNHALSSVVFGASETVDGKSYRITSYKITGDFIMQADFTENITENPGTPYKETSEPGWGNEAAAEPETFVPSAFTGYLVTASAELFTQGKSALLPIPQVVPANASITITYEVTQDGSTLAYERTIPLKDFKDGSGNPISTWELGKRYKYIIQFGGTSKIYFAPSVTEWVEGGTVTVTI